MFNPVLTKFVTSALNPIGPCELRQLPPDPRQKTSGNRTLTSHEWSLDTETETLHDIHKELAGVAHGQVEGLARCSQLWGYGAQVTGRWGTGRSPWSGGRGWG